MCEWLLVIDNYKRGLRLFANVCNFNFKKNKLTLGQTLDDENILLLVDYIRESPDLMILFNKNQQVTNLI
jgi:hypothetical protein